MVSLLLLLGCPGNPDTSVALESRPVDTGTQDSEDTSAESAESADTADTTDTTETADTVDTSPALPIDADGDGHATLESGGDDCDDDDALAYPGAQEWCDDGDQDCDGEPLADGVCSLTQPLETRGYTFNPEYVATTIAIRDVTGDGIDDVLGANGDASTGVMPGTGDIAGLAVWDWVQVWTPTWDCPRNPPGLDVGDIDGDGFNDVAIEAPDCLFGFVIAWGPIDASSELTEWAGPEGENWGTFARVGDVNGDGASDLLRGPTIDGSGTAEVFFGGSRAAGIGLITGVDTQPFTVEYAGDLDGDGICDIIASLQHSSPTWFPMGNLATGEILDAADIVAGSLVDDAAVNAIGSGQAPMWLAVGDWSGDGLDDVVMVDGGQGLSDSQGLLYYDDFSSAEVFASATVENDLVVDEKGYSRFADEVGILRHDDVPAGILVNATRTNVSPVALSSDWPPPGAYALSEVQHLALSFTDSDGEPGITIFKAWGRGDVDGDGWSDVLGAAAADAGYVPWILTPFDDIPWDDPQYW